MNRLKISISGCCKYGPMWETLQKMLREITKNEQGFITRIQRKDDGCDYRGLGEYLVDFRTDNWHVINIELTVTTE